MKKYILLTFFLLNFIHVDCHSMDDKENLKLNISSAQKLIKDDNNDKSISSKKRKAERENQEYNFKKRKIDNEVQVDDSDTLPRETKIENINTKWINSAIIYWKDEKKKDYALKVVDHFFDFSEFCRNLIITNPAVNNDLVISFFIKDAAQEFIRSDEYGADNLELFDIVERLHPILNYYKHKSVCEFWENEKTKYESLQIISNEFDFCDFSSNLIKRNPLMHNEIIVSEFIGSTYEEMVISGEYDLSNTAVIDFFRDLKELYSDYVLKGNS